MNFGRKLSRSFSLFKNFKDALKKEAKKDKEFQKTYAEIQQSETMQTTKKLLHQAKIRKDITQQQLLSASDAASKAVKSMKPKREAKLREESEESEVVEKLRKIQDQLSEASGGFQYGGIRSKEAREALKAEKKRLAAVQEEEVKKNVVEEDPEAGTDLVMHKDSVWRQKWNELKDSSQLLKGIFELKRGYQESDNIFIHYTREFTESVSDRLKSLFSESETAKAVREITARDPKFKLEDFLKECREFIIPEVLEAFLSGDTVTLKLWLSEGPLMSAKAVMEAERKSLDKGLKLDIEILDVRYLDMVTAKIIDNNPILVISFQAQQLFIRKNSEGKRFDDERISRVQYIWAITKEESVKNAVTNGWKIVEFAARDAY